ncbi:DUF4250 domain-containing protein [Lachnospira eligens]|uniref:DUF4250 domain-containing protein n=1 Tax=Lachnospira eligens TaxID=39485 RepID=UPI000E5CEE4A|nr:DUF4250 domain-containing protein [Lachnospira eligens]
MPKDPVMLLSFVNTQLRDNYNTLEELCKSYMVSTSRQLQYIRGTVQILYGFRKRDN